VGRPDPGTTRGERDHVGLAVGFETPFVDERGERTDTFAARGVLLFQVGDPGAGGVERAARRGQAAPRRAQLATAYQVYSTATAGSAPAAAVQVSKSEVAVNAICPGVAN
jgi:hypothetical protein